MDPPSVTLHRLHLSHFLVKTLLWGSFLRKDERYDNVYVLRFWKSLIFLLESIGAVSVFKDKCKAREKSERNNATDFKERTRNMSYQQFSIYSVYTLCSKFLQGITLLLLEVYLFLLKLLPYTKKVMQKKDSQLCQQLPDLKSPSSVSYSTTMSITNTDNKLLIRINDVPDVEPLSAFKQNHLTHDSVFDPPPVPHPPVHQILPDKEPELETCQSFLKECVDSIDEDGYVIDASSPSTASTPPHGKQDSNTCNSTDSFSGSLIDLPQISSDSTDSGFVMVHDDTDEDNLRLFDEYHKLENFEDYSGEKVEGARRRSIGTRKLPEIPTNINAPILTVGPAVSNLLAQNLQNRIKLEKLREERDKTLKEYECKPKKKISPNVELQEAVKQSLFSIEDLENMDPENSDFLIQEKLCSEYYETRFSDAGDYTNNEDTILPPPPQYLLDSSFDSTNSVSDSLMTYVEDDDVEMREVTELLSRKKDVTYRSEDIRRSGVRDTDSDGGRSTPLISTQEFESEFIGFLDDGNDEAEFDDLLSKFMVKQRFV